MYSALGEPCAATTLTERQSDPRCTQQPAAGLSEGLTDPQTSGEPSGYRPTAHSVGLPAGWVGATCHCWPLAEVHTAGPRTAPARVAPTPRYEPSLFAMSRLICWVPLPSSPVTFIRCHCVPSAVWNTTVSPFLSAFWSTAVARKPPPLVAGTTAVSSVRPSACRSDGR